ncbi:cleavage stimulation factor subunit 2 [Nematocida minor]|uniref:cleavage stimulation factor subunit 2 n=1 Tax=Nematocida minor TaxID=1912983 RepID=UPI002220ABFB|nr:cleavage stimulation factor subunit 2 [Nematocida minor]KAI5189415.1 cleavage stimulation factor subunit 2 [Nematocida minor]
MANRGCTVFVGNIDFNIPEEMIVEELSSVGRVIAFRMVTDRATGKSKGYGFCTYESPIVADIAVNRLKIMLNNRPVKINYADNNVVPQAQVENSKLDVEAITETLNKLSPEDTKEIIKHMKQLAVNRPDELKSLLSENPALLSSLLHIMFTLGLAPKESLEDLLHKSFSVKKHHSQILTRILQYHDYEVEDLPEPLKDKAKKIRERLLKK